MAFILTVGYIALAGLWGSPISGASMNPARTFGPDLVGGNFSHYLVYLAGPVAERPWPPASPSSCVAGAGANRDPEQPRAPC